MSHDARSELYQKVILEHNRSPKNFRKMENATHHAVGDNPLCGDHYDIYMELDEDGGIRDIAFEGHGCAISKASASMMTACLKGKKAQEAKDLFEEFHRLIIGELQPEREDHHLGKLGIFSGIWHYPARVKCAGLSWHAMKAALDREERVTTE